MESSVNQWNGCKLLHSTGKFLCMDSETTKHFRSWNNQTSPPENQTQNPVQPSIFSILFASTLVVGYFT